VTSSGSACEYVVLEIGDPTTRALLLRCEEGRVAVIAVGEAPAADPAGGASYLAGACAALASLSARTGRPPAGEEGLPPADRTVVVSRAGACLSAAVVGVMGDISGRSAEKAALAGGATVVGAYGLDDGMHGGARRTALNSNPVDVVVVAGGIDEHLFAFGGGTQVVALGQALAGALPAAGHDWREFPPVIFAGSAEAREQVQGAFGEYTEVIPAGNVRPSMDEESVDEVADRVAGIFAARVATRHPAYAGMSALAGDLLPSGYALLRLTRLFSGGNLLLVDMGNRQVDVCSLINGNLTRTTLPTHAADLGDGDPGQPLDLERVEAWLTTPVGQPALGNMVYNRRLGLTPPTDGSLAQVEREAMLDRAVCREELSQAIMGHRRLASLLKGVQRARTIGEALGKYLSVGGQTTVDFSVLRTVVVTGPGTRAAGGPWALAQVLVEGLRIAGVTSIMVDRGQTLTAVGALAVAHKEVASVDPFDAEHIDPLITVVAPVACAQTFLGRIRVMAWVTIQVGGTVKTARVLTDQIMRLPVTEGREMVISVTPTPGYDFGAGPGKAVTIAAPVGRLGVILDGRPRPVSLPVNPQRRRETLLKWGRAFESPFGAGGDAETARAADGAGGGGRS
jgi:hypothetical protein